MVTFAVLDRSQPFAFILDRMTEPDWPFGPFLADAIRASGQSKRAIARAAGISEGRLRQLEDGYQKSHGVQTPIRTTAHTVARLSRVLGFPLHRGLALAGLESAGGDSEPAGPAAGSTLTLAAWSVDELLYEVRARFSVASGDAPAVPPASDPDDDEGPLTPDQITARSETIVSLQELAEARSAAGDQAGGREVAQLAFDLSRQLDAMTEAEDAGVTDATSAAAPPTNGTPAGRQPR